MVIKIRLAFWRRFEVYSADVITPFMAHKQNERKKHRQTTDPSSGYNHLYANTSAHSIREVDGGWGNERGWHRCPPRTHKHTHTFMSSSVRESSIQAKNRETNKLIKKLCFY